MDLAIYITKKVNMSIKKKEQMSVELTCCMNSEVPRVTDIMYSEYLCRLWFELLMYLSDRHMLSKIQISRCRCYYPGSKCASFKSDASYAMFYLGKCSSFSISVAITISRLKYFCYGSNMSWVLLSFFFNQNKRHERIREKISAS